LNSAVAKSVEVWNRQRLAAVRRIPKTTKLGVKNQHKNGEAFMVKKTIITLAFALIAPLAFAQTSTTTTEQKRTPQRTKTTETASGTVTTTYEPGKIIVVSSESGQDTFCFVLAKAIRYVNKAGREIDERLIKPGTRIELYYDDTGQTRVVNRVVVDED
jgi:hypothetical protein